MNFSNQTNELCSLCKERKAETTSKIYVGEKISSYVIVAMTVTKHYLLIPTCKICDREFSLLAIYRTLSGVFAVIASIYALILLIIELGKLKNGQDVDYRELIVGLVSLVCAIVFIYLYQKMRKRLSYFVSKTKISQTLTQTDQSSEKFQISSQSILWIEKELLKLNQEISGEDRPEYNSSFLQNLPNIILTKDILNSNDVEEAVTDLVKQTGNRFERLNIPFRKPRVEFTTRLPKDEPGHIEFGSYETIIRIHPEYTDNPFALTAILCHELAHFILDHNGLRKDDQMENEKLTDLFVFRCGQGLIYLQGIYDITSQDGQTIESKFGYLSLEEMAYAHVRCASQYGISNSKIIPDYFSGEAFKQVRNALNSLQIKNKNKISEQSAEIIVCPNNHILRLSPEKKSHFIRCPKCGWKKEIWLHRKEHLDYLITHGKQEFEAGNLNQALGYFREAESVDKQYSTAYCWASRCLKKQGNHQEAIKELRRLLLICPDDELAQNEMKNLLYN